MSSTKDESQARYDRIFPIVQPLRQPERIAVAQALEVPPDHPAISWVEWAGRVFLNSPQMKQPDVTRRLNALRRATYNLGMTISNLGEDPYIVIDRRLAKRESGLTLDRIMDALEHLHRAAGIGRPTKTREEAFLLHLARIWQEVHGEWPIRETKRKRTKWGKIVGQESGAFRKFVKASADAYAGDDNDRPWDGVIKRVTGRKSYPLRDMWQSEDLNLLFPP